MIFPLTPKTGEGLEYIMIYPVQTRSQNNNSQKPEYTFQAHVVMGYILGLYFIGVVLNILFKLHVSTAAIMKNKKEYIDYHEEKANRYSQKEAQLCYIAHFNANAYI